MTSATNDSFFNAETCRARIEGLGYRMLGSWADAQDVAQEALIAWHSQSGNQRVAIDQPEAWLLKVATRLCLDRLKSARHRRELYVGPWLPEPLLVHETSPADQAALDDSITMALMLALERLSPLERAAFLLHDIFNYSFDTIAPILDREAAACRQLASRARKAIRSERRRFVFQPEQHQQLLDAFLSACDRGDTQALESILADDVVLYSDSGGAVPAARKILRTREIIVRLFLGLARKQRRRGSPVTAQPATLNALPGLLFRSPDGSIETAFSIAVADGRIQAIYQQRNPAKLAALGECAFSPTKSIARCSSLANVPAADSVQPSRRSI